MRTMLLAAAALLTAVTPTAHATPAPVGVSCGMLVVSQDTFTGGQETYTGIVFAAVAVFDSDLSANPADVHVTCRVDVNGGEVDRESSIVNTAVAVTLGQVTFTAGEAQTVQVCTVLDANGDLSERCDGASSAMVPPQAVCDLLDDLALPVCDTVKPVHILYVLPSLVEPL